MSVKEAPVSGTLLGFTSVKVTVELCPTPAWMVVGENALVMLGGAMTVRVAVLETGPAGRSAVETPVEVALLCTPALELVTVSVTVQPEVGMLSPLKLSAVWPAVRAGAPEAQVQVPPALWFAATCMPARVSLKAPALCATPVGLVSVKVRVELPPLLMVAGENASATVTTPTPRAALALGLAVGVWVEVAPPLVVLG